MNVASFNEIRKKIQKNIEEAKNSISISVAWFTNKELLGQLVEKLDCGCKVEIIISDHIENKRINYKKFIEKGGKVFVIPTESGKFLHDKFAIFDKKNIIAGSYNWTYSAEYYNHEFIIQSDEVMLVKQFLIRFENLKKIVVEYETNNLLNIININAETKEDEFINLELQLYDEFINTISEANTLGARINSINVISYIDSYGAIGGASRLINAGTDNLHSGLIKLWEIGRLDISFENIILKENYRKLFDISILEKAQLRLNALNYNP